MAKLRNLVLLLLVLIGIGSCRDRPNKEESLVAAPKTENYREAYRPQYHFTPSEKWMNDPNGLVYNEGIYHLFYQYYPDDIVWGPMHWGHAISRDMIHWEHKPIALFPDEHGYIFSGSAVVDHNNTSGLGTEGNPPLVAIYTYHDMEGEKAGRNDYQTQGIAFSLDNGDTWVKYKGNPVVENEGIKDFRDPKVFWNTKANGWSMLLVAGDHLQIWNSDNLIHWEKVSEFGKDQGAHGGVWECPDLFPLAIEGGGEKWVLLISINPGAPNGGSGTQYFIGDFDGSRFTSDQTENRWIDWGTDNYAGITYNNTPNKDRIFIGWMSNWDYARDTPTEKWRSAMTIPRKLSLKQIGDSYELLSYPLESLDGILDRKIRKDITIGANARNTVPFDHFNQTEVKFRTSGKDFTLAFKNQLDEHLVMTMDSQRQLFLMDRVMSGKTDFQEDFGSKLHKMPIGNLPEASFEVRILMDLSSIEVFINGGQYVMTDQIFPNENYTIFEIENTSGGQMELKDFTVSGIASIWE